MKKTIIISLASLLSCMAMAQNQRNPRSTNQRTERSTQTQQRREVTQSPAQQYERRMPDRRPPQERPRYSAGNNRTPVYSGGNNYKRNPYIDANTRQYYGQQYNRLPYGATHYHYNDYDYYFHDGRYYRQHNNRYVACRPPVGAVIAASILGAAITAITIEAAATPTTYYYDDGTYYIKGGGNQYTVIAPPIGARISALPYSCEELVLNGNYYYKVDETYYRPIHNYRTGREEYEVVGQSIR